MGTRVDQVMTADPITLPTTATVGDAYALMSERGFRHVPISDDGALVGLISITDIGRLGAAVPEILAKSLGEVMSTKLLTIGPNESVEVAAVKMASRKVNCLLVVVGEKLEGIVTTYDLLDALARRLRGQE